MVERNCYITRTNKFKMRQIFFLLLLLLILFPLTNAAQSLADLLEEEANQSQTSIVDATFKSTRIVSGQSIELVPKNELLFIISHRFGTLNSGIKELYGLDQSQIRLGFEYGLTDNLTIGVGRSSYQKLVDGFIKYKILSQKEGAKDIPITLTFFSSSAVFTDDWPVSEREYKTSHRFYYVHQVMAARKFNDKLSLQLSPGIIHRNIVQSNQDENNVIYTGFGGRYKITKRLTLNAEYFYIISKETSESTDNTLSLGIDIETGGHVFHLAFSNSRGLHEKVFVGENSGKWTKGFIHFGFNINRIFSFNGKKH
jgi:Membrane bound beta barrel domain (DUF5777)